MQNQEGLGSIHYTREPSQVFKDILFIDSLADIGFDNCKVLKLEVSMPKILVNWDFYSKLD